MNVAIEIPEDVSARLAERWSNLPQRTLEALAVEAYRSGALTAFEVQRMLKLDSRWTTEEFLKKANAYLDYSESDLDADLAAIRSASRQ